jgi:hypothetical protein
MFDGSPAAPRKAASRLRLPQAGYWLGVGVAMLAWHGVLGLAAGYPLPVHLALVAMVAAGGLWGHTILFPGGVREPKPATVPVPVPARRASPGTPQAVPVPAPAASVPPAATRPVAEPARIAAAPAPEAGPPVPLVQQFCALVAAESRPDTRADLAAVLRAGAGPTLHALMEAYVRENGGRASAAPPPPAARPAEPAPVTRWALIDGALPTATGRVT